MLREKHGSPLPTVMKKSQKYELERWHNSVTVRQQIENSHEITNLLSPSSNIQNKSTTLQIIFGLQRWWQALNNQTQTLKVCNSDWLSYLFSGEKKMFHNISVFSKTETLVNIFVKQKSLFGTFLSNNKSQYIFGVFIDKESGNLWTLWRFKTALLMIHVIFVTPSLHQEC